MNAHVLILPRQCGKSMERERSVAMAILVTLYDNGGEMPFARLVGALPATRREIFRALHRQYDLGNVKRHYSGEPICLTASAKFALAAGRSSMGAE